MGIAKLLKKPLLIKNINIYNTFIFKAVSIRLLKSGTVLLNRAYEFWTSHFTSLIHSTYSYGAYPVYLALCKTVKIWEMVLILILYKEYTLKQHVERELFCSSQLIAGTSNERQKVLSWR